MAGLPALPQRALVDCPAGGRSRHHAPGGQQAPPTDGASRPGPQPAAGARTCLAVRRAPIRGRPALSRRNLRAMGRGTREAAGLRRGVAAVKAAVRLEAMVGALTGSE